ncbi:MAG: MFS transporter [Pseudolysinimonas sp.]|uniref:MFS transporter n=1 Tax=Pseudolysinimonas sp. TaxID=2680009 RepID=UPI00326767DA
MSDAGSPPAPEPPAAEPPAPKLPESDFRAARPVGTDPTVTAPLPIQTIRPSFSTVFATFESRNFRLLIISLFANSLGSWMARVAVDWLMLELTGNVALVGLAVAFQFAPQLLLGIWAGLLADRLPRRNVVLVTQSVTAFGFAVLGTLTILGVVAVWHVLLVAAVIGVAGALEGPARSSLTSQTVAAGRLPIAISISGITFHLGGLIGPAISGGLIGFIGPGWCIAISSLGSLICVVGFALMRSRELTPAPRSRPQRGQIREGFRYVAGKPRILWPIVLIGFIATFGMTLPVLFTAAASERGYDTGSAGYGLLTALAAAGAFTGAILSTRRRSLRLRSLVLLAGLYGAAIVVAGGIPFYGALLAGALGLGIFRLLFATGAEAMVQLSTNLGIRGRVVAIYLLVLIGGQALGGLLVGWVAETFGMMPAYLLAGGVPMVASLVVALILGKRNQLRLRVNLFDVRRLIRIVPREQIIVDR